MFNGDTAYITQLKQQKSKRCYYVRARWHFFFQVYSASEMTYIVSSGALNSTHSLLPSMNLIRPPSTELLQFLTGYVTLRCDLDLWPFDLGLMSRDATWLFNTCTKFEHDTTYRSRLRTTTNFHWPQLSPNFYVFGGKEGQISNLIFLTRKRHFLRGNDA